MARDCIFCGRAGPLTREHALPQWFARAFGRGTKFNIDQDSETGPRVTRTGIPLDIVARIVCTACNSGWMSQLESQASVVLLPLMAGRTSRLDADAMRVIALWCTKTAVVYAMSTSWEVPSSAVETARYIYEQREPPNHAGVWVGAYIPNAAPPQAAKVFPRRLDAILPGGDPAGISILDWTAGLGYLAIKVVLLPQVLWQWPGTVQYQEPRPLVPVWPVAAKSPYEWPPHAWYNEVTLTILSFALAGRPMELTPIDRPGGRRFVFR